MKPRTEADVKKGCGTTLGHGESCQKGHLCDACTRELATMVREANLVRDINILRGALESILRHCQSGIGYDPYIYKTADEALNATL